MNVVVGVVIMNGICNILRCYSAKLFTLLLIVVLAACSEGSQQIDNPQEEDGDVPDGDSDQAVEEEEEIDFCGFEDDEKFPNALSRNKIYYGTESPELFEMTPGQQKSLVALVNDYGGYYSNFCSAVVINPRAVLTAAHCIDGIWGPEYVKIAVGPDVAIPEAILDVEEMHMHPDYQAYSPTPAAHDHALLILSGSVYEKVPDIQPVPYNDAPLDESIIGKEVQNGGFGATHLTDQNTLRWWTAETLASFGMGEFVVSGNGESGVCFGDSGGPSYYDFGYGLTVIGNVSWGDESCVDFDHFSDTATDSTWIESLLPDVSCGDIDEVGVCVGERAQWCENEVLREDNCLGRGMICGLDEQANNRCIPDPCGGVTFEGYCDDEHVAHWCEEHQLKHRKCIPCNQVCGWSGYELGNYCVYEPLDLPDGDEDSIEEEFDTDPDISGPCGAFTWAGCCRGDVAVWCDVGGEILETDCAAEFGNGCGWLPRNFRYNCGGEGEDPSGVFPIECPDEPAGRRR